MIEEKRSPKGGRLKRFLAVVSGHGFVLFIGLLAGRLIGKEELRNLGISDGFWFWIGTYFLGWFVLLIAFFLNKCRERVLGNGEGGRGIS
jgi:hypothetical protein